MRGPPVRERRHLTGGDLALWSVLGLFLWLAMAQCTISIVRVILW
jgi:hypothetical protein